MMKIVENGITKTKKIKEKYVDFCCFVCYYIINLTKKGEKDYGIRIRNQKTDL